MDSRNDVVIGGEAFDLIGVPVCIKDRDSDELIFISSALCRILGIAAEHDLDVRRHLADGFDILRTSEDLRAQLKSEPDVEVLMNEYFPNIGVFLKRVTRAVHLSDGTSAIMHTFEMLNEQSPADSPEAMLEHERTARRNFLIKMSHDLRAQLNTINGIASVVLDLETANDSVRCRIAEIEHACMNMLTMLDNILEMSGIDALEDFDGFSDEPFIMPSGDVYALMRDVREKSASILRSVHDCTILLADDIDIHRDIIKMYLDGTGIIIDTATDGAEALEMFLADPARYDLLLIDVHMPELSGYEVARAIRSIDDEHARRVPMIAMTANALTEDEGRSFSSGMNGHLTKPIDRTDLLALLAYHLKDRAARPLY